MTRPTMQEVYMDFAKLIAKRSTCLERQVGAVITSADFERVYSVGYNGNAKGRSNTCDGIGYKGSCGCIHAEQNALIKCGVIDKDKVMFVTLEPCVACAKMMVNSGFSKVYYGQEWKSHEGLQILKDAGIEVSLLTKDSTPNGPVLVDTLFIDGRHRKEFVTYDRAKELERQLHDSARRLQHELETECERLGPNSAYPVEYIQLFLKQAGIENITFKYNYDKGDIENGKN